MSSETVLLKEFHTHVIHPLFLKYSIKGRYCTSRSLWDPNVGVELCAPWDVNLNLSLKEKYLARSNLDYGLRSQNEVILNASEALKFWRKTMPEISGLQCDLLYIDKVDYSRKMVWTYSKMAAFPPSEGSCSYTPVSGPIFETLWHILVGIEQTVLGSRYIYIP